MKRDSPQSTAATSSALGPARLFARRFVTPALCAAFLTCCHAAPSLTTASSARRSPTAEAPPSGPGERNAETSRSGTPPAPPGDDGSAAVPTPSTGSPESAASHCASRADCLAHAREAERRDKWALALSHLLRVEMGSDAQLLAERGFVALRAGKLDQAQSDNVQAFYEQNDADLLGQILYNQGRVEEARGAKVIAAAYYEASLDARSSDSVDRRLESLGRVETQCASVSSIEHFCACGRARLGLEGQVIQLSDGPPLGSGGAEFTQEGPRCVSPALSAFDGRLRVVAYGLVHGRGPYEVVEARAREVRPIVVLEEAFEPGAFGVHNSVEISAITTHVVGTTPYARIEWEKSDYDQNMAGLEVMSMTTKFHTLCVETHGKLACPFQIPILQTSSVEHRPEFLEAGADPELRAELEEAKKSDTTTTTTLSYRIDERGFVHIGAVRGEPLAGYDLPKSGPLFRE